MPGLLQRLVGPLLSGYFPFSFFGISRSFRRCARFVPGPSVVLTPGALGLAAALPFAAHRLFFCCPSFGACLFSLQRSVIPAAGALGLGALLSVAFSCVLPVAWHSDRFLLLLPPPAPPSLLWFLSPPLFAPCVGCGAVCFSCCAFFCGRVFDAAPCAAGLVCSAMACCSSLRCAFPVGLLCLPAPSLSAAALWAVRCQASRCAVGCFVVHRVRCYSVFGWGVWVCGALLRHVLFCCLCRFLLPFMVLCSAVLRSLCFDCTVCCCGVFVLLSGGALLPPPVLGMRCFFVPLVVR